MDAGRGVGSHTRTSDLWEQMGRISEVIAWKVNTYWVPSFLEGKYTYWITCAYVATGQTIL